MHKPYDWEKDVFFAINYFYQYHIKLGDTKSLEVVAKGKMEVPTRKDKIKVKDIYYAPPLKYYFTTISQMLEKDYKIIFEDRICKILYKRRKLLTTIKMLKNRLFSLQFVDRGGEMAFSRVCDI